MSATVARKPYRLTAPRVPEHSIQKQVADVLRLELGPAGKVNINGTVWWAVDHANFAGVVPGIRIGRGIIAGLPDLWVLHRGAVYVIELKAVGGQLSEAQQAVLPALAYAGGRIGVAQSSIDTLALLDAWEIPRRRRV